MLTNMLARRLVSRKMLQHEPYALLEAVFSQILDPESEGLSGRSGGAEAVPDLGVGQGRGPGEWHGLVGEGSLLVAYWIPNYSKVWRNYNNFNATVKLKGVL